MFMALHLCQVYVNYPPTYQVLQGKMRTFSENIRARNERAQLADPMFIILPETNKT